MSDLAHFEGLRGQPIAKAINVSFNTLQAIVRGQAASTHENAVALARLLAIIGVNPQQVTPDPLPTIGIDIKVGDLRRLHRLTTGAFTRRWIEHRLAYLVGAPPHGISRDQLPALLVAFGHAQGLNVDPDRAKAVCSALTNEKAIALLATLHDLKATLDAETAEQEAARA